MRTILALILVCAACGNNKATGPLLPGHGAQVFQLQNFIQVLGGSSDDDVWLANAKGTVRWNGQALVPVDLGRFYAFAIAGAAADDLWIGGSARTADGTPGLQRWDGKTLQPFDTGEPVLALVATRRDDVWATGNQHLARFDGAKWSFVAAPPAPIGILGGLQVTAGSAPNDVWACLPSTYWAGTGSAGKLFHYDGAQWSQVDVPADYQNNLSPFQWAPSSDELWVKIGAPIVRRTTAGWQTLDAGGNVLAFGGRSPSDAFVVVVDASGSRLLHYDGHAFTTLDSTSLRYEGLWVGPSSVWVAAGNQAVRYPL